MKPLWAWLIGFNRAAGCIFTSHPQTRARTYIHKYQFRKFKRAVTLAVDSFFWCLFIRPFDCLRSSNDSHNMEQFISVCVTLCVMDPPWAVAQTIQTNFISPCAPFPCSLAAFPFILIIIVITSRLFNTSLFLLLLSRLPHHGCKINASLS